MDSSLYRTITSGDVATLKQIIASDDDHDLLHQMSHHKNTILHIAVQFHVLGCVEEICKSCPSLLTKPNSKGDTPLHVASRLGSSNFVAYLIHHARFHYEDVERGVGCHHAEEESTTCITVLQHMVRMKNEESDTALHEAVRYKWFDVVKLLTVADPTFEYFANNSGETPLYLAADNGMYNVVAQILETCSSSAHGGPHGRTALHAAVVSGNSGIINLLLEKKKSTSIIKEVDENGSSALHYSAYLERVEVAVKLLELDPSIANLRNKDGKTALHVAASSRMNRHVAYHNRIIRADLGTIFYGNFSVVRTVLFSNYYAKRLEYEFLTPSDQKTLLGKVRFVHLKMLEYMFTRHEKKSPSRIAQLIEEVTRHCPGCWELVDNKGRNFLHVAVVNGQSDVIKYVLQESKIIESLINDKDHDGNTPLHLLVLYSGGTECLEIICSYPGMNKKAINKDNFTAFDILLQKMQEKRQGINEEFQKMAYTYLFEGGSVSNFERRLMIRGEIEKDGLKEEKKEGYEGEGTVKRKVEIMREQSGNQTHMLVATLIATVTFAAGFTLPGGYNSDGTARLIKQPAFVAFVVFNTIAMFLSASVLFIHFWFIDDKMGIRIRKNLITANCTLFSVITMMVAFASGTYVVLSPSPALAVSLCVLSCSFMPFSLLLLGWIREKY